MTVDKLEKENQQLKREDGNPAINLEVDSDMRRLQAENTALKNSIKSNLLAKTLFFTNYITRIILVFGNTFLYIYNFLS